MIGELLRDTAYQPGLDQRLVTLHIDDDALDRIAALRGDFGDAVGAGSMVVARQQRLMAMTSDSGSDVMVVGSDDDFGRAAGACPVGDVHHHRLAGDVEQRLARQPRRGVARGNDYDEFHVNEWKSEGVKG